MHHESSAGSQYKQHMWLLAPWHCEARDEACPHHSLSFLQGVFATSLNVELILRASRAAQAVRISFNHKPRAQETRAAKKYHFQHRLESASKLLTGQCIAGVLFIQWE